MEKNVYSKAISMNVTTYQILNDKGEQLVSLLQQFFDQFLNYINVDLEIHIELMNRRNSSMKFNDKNLQKTYNFLLEGKVESLYIGSCERMSSSCSDDTVINHYPTLCTIAIGCNLAATYPPHFSDYYIFTNDFNLSLSERLFDNNIPQHIQDEFVELFKKAVIALDGDTGFITYDSTSVGTPMITPYEDYWAIHPHRPPGFSKRLRGYFWLNYLSSQHILILGGIEEILSKAPCDVKESIVQHDQLGVFLQLTDNISDYSDDQLLELLEFLWPLLDIETKFERNNGKEPVHETVPGYIVRLLEY